MIRQKAKLGDYDYTGISVITLENSVVKRKREPFDDVLDVLGDIHGWDNRKGVEENHGR